MKTNDLPTQSTSYEVESARALVHEELDHLLDHPPAFGSMIFELTFSDGEVARIDRKSSLTTRLLSSKKSQKGSTK